MMGTGIMNGYGFGGFGLIGMILNLVITLGVIIGIVLLIVWLVRRFSASETFSAFGFDQANGQPNPREILQSRYARGEISRDEYQQMLADVS
jgi:putative membrane protein